MAGQKGVAPRNLALARSNAGIIFAEAGKLDDAERQLTEAVSLLRAEHLEGVSLARAEIALADVERRRGQSSVAIDLGKQALELHERSAGEDNVAMALARAQTGAAMWAAGQQAEGEKLLIGFVSFSPLTAYCSLIHEHWHHSLSNLRRKRYRWL